MKWAERILGLLAITGLLMKFFIVSGGGLLTVFSLTTLAIVYYPLSFFLFNKVRIRDVFKKSAYTKISAKKTVISIGAGMALASTCLGIVYILQHWKGGPIIIHLGIVSSLIVLLITLIGYFKGKEQYYLQYFIRIGIITGFGVLLLTFPSRTFKRFQYRNHPRLLHAHEMYMDNPESEELREELMMEYYRIIMSEEQFEAYMANIHNASPIEEPVYNIDPELRNVCSLRAHITFSDSLPLYEAPCTEPVTYFKPETGIDKGSLTFKEATHGWLQIGKDQFHPELENYWITSDYVYVSLKNIPDGPIPLLAIPVENTYVSGYISNVSTIKVLNGYENWIYVKYMDTEGWIAPEFTGMD